MGQNKLERFEQIRGFANVLEQPENMQGKWNDFFKNDHPIVLELACGKGEYALGLGRLFPEKNFIGVDIKGNRIWRGAKTALDEGLTNVAFLRTHIDQITNYFAKNEVSEIWITFPDPQLRFSKLKKRLTHPKYLRFYREFLQPGGVINLKTDSPDLYKFTKAVVDFYLLPLLADKDNVYAEENVSDVLKIRTHYESLDIAQSNRIHYVQFQVPENLPLEKDVLLKDMLREQTVD